MTNSKLPKQPWQFVSVNLVDFNNIRFVMTTTLDYIRLVLRVLTSEEVIGRLKDVFAPQGSPCGIRSDTEIQFERGSEDYGFNNRILVLIFHMQILRKSKDPKFRLREYRNSPLGSGL